MRALVVEDEEKLAVVIARALKAEGFAVDTAHDGARGLELALVYNYDIIILDIMLPQVTGSDILRRLRESKRQMPILMLTARDSVADKVAHIEAGADDYLTKPFSMAELLVRIRALLRRTPVQRLDILKIGDLEIDRLGRQVKRGGKRIKLSAKEYALLEYLALNSGRVLSRAMIIEHVWDENFEALTNIVDVYVRQLRLQALRRRWCCAMERPTCRSSSSAFPVLHCPIPNSMIWARTLFGRRWRSCTARRCHILTAASHASLWRILITKRFSRADYRLRTWRTRCSART